MTHVLSAALALTPRPSGPPQQRRVCAYVPCQVCARQHAPVPDPWHFLVQAGVAPAGALHAVTAFGVCQFCMLAGCPVTTIGSVCRVTVLKYRSGGAVRESGRSWVSGGHPYAGRVRGWQARSCVAGAAARRRCRDSTANVFAHGVAVAAAWGSVHIRHSGLI